MTRTDLVAEKRKAAALLARVYSRQLCAEMRATLEAYKFNGTLPENHPLWLFVLGWREARRCAQEILDLAQESLELFDNREPCEVIDLDEVAARSLAKSEGDEGGEEEVAS